MFLQTMGSRPGSISDAVHTEVLGALHGPLVPIVFAGLSQAIVGSITARQTGDVVTAIITAVGVAVIFIRAFEVLAFRRRVAKGPPLDRAEERLWKRRYALGTAATSFTIGLLASRSLSLGDSICSIMAIGIAFGFGAGIVARLSMLPFLAVADLTVMSLPAIAVAFTRLDAPHAGLGMLMAIYMVGAYEMVRLTFNSAINQRLLKQKFEELARLDPMTGVCNRSVLAIDLPRIVAGGAIDRVAVYAIDLDHFKAANDRFGHPVGDALLKQVAERLTALAGAGDLLVRMGGDEFILVQKSVPSFDDAERMAKRIFETVTAPYELAGHDIVIGVSIGIALSPDDGASTEALLSRSDKALYQAKAYRGGYVFARDLPVAPVDAVSHAPAARQHAA